MSQVNVKMHEKDAEAADRMRDGGRARAGRTGGDGGTWPRALTRASSAIVSLTTASPGE